MAEPLTIVATVLGLVGSGEEEIGDACEVAGFPRYWFREGDGLPMPSHRGDEEADEAGPRKE